MLMKLCMMNFKQISSLRRVVTARETINDIQFYTKDILDYIKNPSLLTTNELCGQMLIRFYKTYKLLEEL